MFRKHNIYRIFSLLILLTLSCQSIAATLTKSDIAILHEDINQMYQAFEAGDASVFLEKTHPAILKIIGGKAQFEKSLKAAIKQFKTLDITFVNSSLGIPDKLYDAGDQEVCFVPRTSVMKASGKEATSTGFLIAVRKKGSQEWSYMDGSGLRKNKELLWQILPDLQKDITFPENKLEPK